MRQAGRALVIACGLTATAMAQQAGQTLTLPEAISLAVQRNPDLAAVEQRVASARAALRQVESAFYPSLRVSETYAASDNPVQAFMMSLNQRALSFGPATDFNDPSTTDNFNTRVLLTYSLYDGGRRVAARDAARSDSKAATHALAAARNDLIFEVTRSFHTIGKARQFIRATEASVTSLQATARAARARFEEGTALKTDLLDAEVRLAQGREDLLMARNALALSETVFRNVLGVGEAEAITATELEAPVAMMPVDPGPGDATPGTTTTGAASPAPGGSSTPDLPQRPELLAAREAVAAARRHVRVAEGGRLPRVDVFGSYDLDTGDLERFSDSFMGGVNVELQVFDGFLTRGQVATARAKLAAAREHLRRTELAVQMEITQARLRLTEARARLETTTRAVEQAAESLLITKERYANGLTPLAQLLDAETASTTACQRRAAAAADLLIATAALDKALGTVREE